MSGLRIALMATLCLGWLVDGAWAQLRSAAGDRDRRGFLERASERRDERLGRNPAGPNPQGPNAAGPNAAGLNSRGPNPANPGPNPNLRPGAGGLGNGLPGPNGNAANGLAPGARGANLGAGNQPIAPLANRNPSAPNQGFNGATLSANQRSANYAPNPNLPVGPFNADDAASQIRPASASAL